MLVLRPATEADLPGILAITNQAIVETTAVWSLAPVTLQARRSWWMERTAAGFPVFAAVDGDQVLGFSSYGSFRPWEGFVNTVEHSVYVDPAAQGRGLGRTLLAAIIDHATETGRHVMVGGIEAGNQASIALHRRAGFEEAGTLRQVGRKFDRWLDLLFMQKIL